MEFFPEKSFLHELVKLASTVCVCVCVCVWERVRERVCLCVFDLENADEIFSISNTYYLQLSNKIRCTVGIPIADIQIWKTSKYLTFISLVSGWFYCIEYIIQTIMDRSSTGQWCHNPTPDWSAFRSPLYIPKLGISMYDHFIFLVMLLFWN